MTGTSDVETVERIVPAPPEAIFALLANPARHPDIDGSGSVRRARSSQTAVQLGDTFGMAMKLGIPYSMANEVIEYEENRRIAWQTRPPGFAARFFGGRIWRYELEPVEGGTRVRESWDISAERPTNRHLRVGAVRRRTREAMEKSLANLEQLVARA
jgi:uncharacterized protein YndB with AHSA1/START domain